MLPCTRARQMYIGEPGLGSAPGPPTIAPLEASGVNGELAGCHEMLWPSMPPFCACTNMLEQQSRSESNSRRSRRRKKVTAQHISRLLLMHSASLVHEKNVIYCGLLRRQGRYRRSMRSHSEPEE